MKSKSVKIRITVYENRTDYERLRSFLGFQWWSKFAEGGVLGHRDKGKHLRTVYETWDD